MGRIPVYVFVHVCVLMHLVLHRESALGLLGEKLDLCAEHSRNTCYNGK